MNKYVRLLLPSFLAVFLFFGVVAIRALTLPQVSVPDGGYLFDTTLQSAIGSADTSMTLVSGIWKNGTSLSGYQCFTVDIGTPKTEYICGTASGTAVTGLLRGIDPLNPLTQVTALKFSHRAGSDVRITDYPLIQVQKRLVNGEDPYPNPLSMDTSIATSTYTTYNLVTKQYADGIALQGAPTATTSVAGIVRIATTAQVIAGTGMSGGYTLVPATSLFSTTSSATTLIPVTNTSGKLAQGFLDLTTNWNFSNISGTSTSLVINTATSTSVTADNFNLIPAGSMQMYASTTAPGGWLIANGTQYATSTYPRLFAVIGYTYGGSGANFNIPNMGGRTAFGPSTSTPFSTTLGTTGGATTTTVTTITSGATGQFTNPGGTGTMAWSGATGGTITSTGTTASILPPYIILNYIIKY